MQRVVKEGDKKGKGASSRDISFLDKVFSSAGEGIIVSNARGEIYLANARSAAIFGYSKKELEQLTIEDLVPPKMREGHKQHRKEYLEKPSARPMGIGYDLSGIRKDGSIFPLEISLSYLKHDGEDWVVAFIIDITLRKAQEEEIIANRKKLEEYANRLEAKVKERTQEIEHMNLGLRSQIHERKRAEERLKASLEDLEKARGETLKALDAEKELNELKSRFISMASHEFRTPLTTISSSANLIERYTETEQQPNRKKHVERIRSAVRNLTNILNDFLSLEKLESGKINLNKQWFDPNSLLTELEEDFSLNLKPGQKLQVHYQQVLPKIYSDPHLLKNILINLLSNAIKYSPEGETIDIKPQLIQEGQIEIAVIDKGMGIPKNEQKNLFKRFFRARNAANLQGTGLGLNIVKRYVGLLDGRITFVSNEGEGSNFTVILPTTLQNNTK